jgi:2-methylcitrate dehydratase
MASLSIPYTAAVALVEGAVGTEHFTPRYVESPTIRAVMRKIEVVVDPEITAAFPAKWSCRVEAFFPDGTREVESVGSARGDPLNPMPFDEVREKFHTLTTGIVDRTAADRICAYVEGIETEPDVSELASLLREAGRGSDRLIP